MHKVSRTVKLDGVSLKNYSTDISSFFQTFVLLMYYDVSDCIIKIAELLQSSKIVSIQNVRIHFIMCYFTFL